MLSNAPMITQYHNNYAQAAASATPKRVKNSSGVRSIADPCLIISVCPPRSWRVMEATGGRDHVLPWTEGPSADIELGSQSFRLVRRTIFAGVP